MELMFQAKASGRSRAVHDAAGALFAALADAMGPPPSDAAAEAARDTFKLVFAATMRGIAALVASHRVDRTQGDHLLDAATRMMLESDLAARAVSVRSPGRGGGRGRQPRRTDR